MLLNDYEEVIWMRKTISLISGIILVSSLVLMCVLVFGNVVLRYVFNSGITWAEELSRFLLIFVTLMGSVYALAKNEHLQVDIFIKKLPPKAQMVLKFIANVTVFVSMLLLLQGSWKLVIIGAGTLAPATHIPMSYIYGIALVASFCMAGISLNNIIRLFIKKDVQQDEE